MNLKKAFDKEMSLLRYVHELREYLILKKNALNGMRGMHWEGKELKYYKEFTTCLFIFGCTLQFYKRET